MISNEAENAEIDQYEQENGLAKPRTYSVLHVQVAGGDVTVEQLEQIGKLFHTAFENDGTITTYDNVTASVVRADQPIDGIVVQPTITAEHIASVCHAVNRAYCEATGDDVHAHWEDATAEIRNSAYQGVLFALRYNATPEEQHKSWMAQKIADGWEYGPVKDAETKTHPCIVSYSELPEAQKVKDYLFAAVVRSLRSKLAAPDTTNTIDVEKLTDTGSEKVSILTLGVGDKFALNGTSYVVNSTPYVNYAKAVPVWSVDVKKIDATPPVQHDEATDEEVTPQPAFAYPKASDFEPEADSDESTGTPEQGA